MEDLVGMARAAQHDERLSDGALYGKLADELERIGREADRRDVVRLVNEKEALQQELAQARAALLPFADLRVPSKRVGTTGYYSIRYDDIGRAQEVFARGQ